MKASHSRARARLQKPQQSALQGLRASVIVNRNGAVVEVRDVPAEDATKILAAVLDAYRVLSQTHAEVIPELGAVHGGTPTYIAEDFGAEGHRAGFKP